MFIFPKAEGTLPEASGAEHRRDAPLAPAVWTRAKTPRRQETGPSVAPRGRIPSGVWDSPLFLADLLTGQEPRSGDIPVAASPAKLRRQECRRSKGRFMGSHLCLSGLLTILPAEQSVDGLIRAKGWPRYTRMRPSALRFMEREPDFLDPVSRTSDGNSNFLNNA